MSLQWKIYIIVKFLVGLQMHASLRPCYGCNGYRVDKNGRKTTNKHGFFIVGQLRTINIVVESSVAMKLRRSFKLWRFLSKDPTSSSSLVHFQMPKNLWSFEDFRPKIVKIFWENLTIFWTKLSEKVQNYVLFLKLWTSIFPT